jgi:inorganic pyrophosphatase
VLVVGSVPVVPGAVIRCRPVGALLMQDEAGADEKVLAVPVDALHPFYANVRSYRDLPTVLLEQIEHFFRHYKDLEKGKWVKVANWVDAGEAVELVRAALERHRAARELQQ